MAAMAGGGFLEVEAGAEDTVSADEDGDALRCIGVEFTECCGERVRSWC
jgi:hypothetical protein